jgi:'Cold-shock' DNA-binding domain
MPRALDSLRQMMVVRTYSLIFSEIQTRGFKSLQEQQKVSFEVRQGPKGKLAANIIPL